METLSFAIVSMTLWLIASRAAYGAWLWESTKTWYWTREEIQYLRDVQKSNRLAREFRGSVKKVP